MGIHQPPSGVSYRADRDFEKGVRESTDEFRVAVHRGGTPPKSSMSVGKKDKTNAEFYGAADKVQHIKWKSTGGINVTRIRVNSFSVSIDGFGAGPEQDIDNPLGVGGEGLHHWAFQTRTIQKVVFGADKGTTGIDDDFIARGFENMGAWILGRNMFGPIRGPWPDHGWMGWWGDNPPYHVPVYVLTHHARPSLEMDGGTTFHFVTGGIHEALERAREAANGKDVRIGGGPGTIQQYLREGLIDELHIAISPVVLGAGERLFDGVDLKKPGYTCDRFVASENATHVILRRNGK